MGRRKKKGPREKPKKVEHRWLGIPCPEREREIDPIDPGHLERRIIK